MDRKLTSAYLWPQQCLWNPTDAWPRRGDPDTCGQLLYDIVEMRDHLSEHNRIRMMQQLFTS